MLSFTKLIFTQALHNEMRIYAPKISAADILAWGATGFRDYVPKENLPGVLFAYNKAITTTLYFGGHDGHGLVFDMRVGVEEC
jgi:hypothetical protein